MSGCKQPKCDPTELSAKNALRAAVALSLVQLTVVNRSYYSVLGKRPLPDNHPCTKFQGVNVAASILMYGNYIPGKLPCGPKSRVTCMLKRPWVLTRDTTVVYQDGAVHPHPTCIHDVYTSLRFLVYLGLAQACSGSLRIICKVIRQFQRLRYFFNSRSLKKLLMVRLVQYYSHYASVCACATESIL